MWDSIITFIIVIAAAAYLLRQWLGKKRSCHDSSTACDGCAPNNNQSEHHC